MKILVSGASGLIGSSLVRRLAASNEVVRLVRRGPSPGTAELQWDPTAAAIDAERLEGFDAVVHLAGENIGSGRWTAAKKARIRDSRAEGRFLAKTLAGLARPPKVLVSASAVGFYGNRGDEELDESSVPGEGFLAEVCRDWEAAASAASEAGIRVVLSRFGVVLAREGGALARLLPLFRFGLGGRLGSGRQFMSWIALDDAVRAVEFVLENDSLRGPINVTSPQPVTNREFTEALASVLRRPALLPAPAMLLRAALGEMADEMLLSSARVFPRRLLGSSYRFSKAELKNALEF